MRWFRAVLAVDVLALALAASPALATPPVPITFGTSWDGPANELQVVVDRYLGVPGAIDVHADYIGAHAGDLDAWFWVGNSLPVLMITEIAGNANVNELGWYRETGAKPLIDGVDDGIVFTGSKGAGANAIVAFPAGVTRFGFFLDPHRTFTTPAGMAKEMFFTNRLYNDPGFHGAGATHAPYGGDAQAIVFDVSRWKGPNTYLVCFEDLDAGLPVQACCSGTDDDFNDMVFQVRALGATPVNVLTFGALKARYR
jgi:hypothetical protein